MSITNRSEPLVLFLGDILAFLVALYMMLIVRYGGFPQGEIFYAHLAPFAILFVIWAGVFFIAGLYEKHTLILKSKLSSIILNAQVSNSILAVLFFYFIPYFGITPKINLFIYLFFSFCFLYLWRMYGTEALGIRKRQRAILIGSGDEMKELRDEVNNNNRYHLSFLSSVDLDDVDALDVQEELIGRIYAEGITSIVVDLKHEKIGMLLPHLYNLIFSKIRFIDKYKVYEDIFDRVPLSLVQYNWFLENISLSPKMTYDTLKRIMDIGLSIVLLVCSLPLYPLVFLALRFEGKGSIFCRQTRLGKNNAHISLIKFRSMTTCDGSGEVTRVGSFLRKTRIDELPQLWNVLKGDLSLIGPRPELPDLARIYEKEVPYYHVRHLLKPGLSGWAQIYHEHHPHHRPDVTETKVKLSYDLYYIKNRSFLLDIKIALRTLQILLSRKGL